MKYFLLILSLSTLTFFFYKGLEKDPTLIPSNLIEKKVPDFELKKQISSLLLKDRICLMTNSLKL